LQHNIWHLAEASEVVFSRKGHICFLQQVLSAPPAAAQPPSLARPVTSQPTMSFLSAIVNAGQVGLISSAAPALSLLLKGLPAAAAAQGRQPIRRGVSHLSGQGHGSSSTPGRELKPFALRGTAASHLRSFAAQPALAEDNQMFCVSITYTQPPSYSTAT
jgi:hypothetical protein